MKKLVIIMIITNIFLATQIIIDRKEMQEEKLNKQICNLEEIPMYEIGE